MNNKKVIGVLLTYNCENLVQKAINKIPKNEFDDLICSDDGSKDNTTLIVEKNNIKVLRNEHKGYGGNLFAGIKKAFEMGATHVVELHGDGQYDFNQVKFMKKKFDDGADLVLGNRFYNYLQPLKDKMDFVKYFGNIFLTFIASIGLSIKSNDLFPGFRGYSKKFYEKTDTSKTSLYYWFSFEIIAQCKYLNLNIKDVDVRCDYRTEHHSMPISKGIPLIFSTLKIIFLYRLAKLGIKYSFFKNL
ncbi:glycosyltransferase family 2 protein [Candidatus Pelagibacter sp.]|nr:glycosyltransferase family 2 protein [Candidatus Pelagibacter sp.]